MGRGRAGPLQEKVIYALLSGAAAPGRPASPRRAGTCRCHLRPAPSARAAGGTCEAGAWPRRNGRRRGGAAVAAARGAASRGPRRGALTPHPAASQTPSCDTVSHRICPCASSCLPLGRPSRVRSHSNGRARGPGARAPPAPSRGEPPRVAREAASRGPAGAGRRVC